MIYYTVFLILLTRIVFWSLVIFAVSLWIVALVNAEFYNYHIMVPVFTGLIWYFLNFMKSVKLF